MRYYQFRTFRTSYFFPPIGKSSKFLFGLYHPYGSAIIKAYWWMFKSCGLVRSLFAVDESQMEQLFPYKIIVGMCPEKTLVSFNLGTPGEEQKISMLGYYTEDGGSFFAKYSVKEKAKALSKNEIRVLKELEGMQLAPSLLMAKIEADSVFFITTRVEGKAYTSMELTGQLVDILQKLGGIRTGHDSTSGLHTSLSHGDFCPWNMLQKDGKISLIDWEMADERTLGYDLFLFLIHARMMMGGSVADILGVLEQNKGHIERYFSTLGIADYYPYLTAFIHNRMEEAVRKGHPEQVSKYEEILQTIK